jgi:hypothetical protein
MLKMSRRSNKKWLEKNVVLKFMVWYEIYSEKTFGSLLYVKLAMAYRYNHDEIQTQTYNMW